VTPSSAGLVPGRRRMPRAQRREQILDAATRAFARRGYAATGLDDVAAEAGVTRVILYRHFESKADLYQAVLDQFCAVLGDHVAEPVGGFTDASIDGLVAAAVADPAGFHLLFHHTAREPEFRARVDDFYREITRTALTQLRPVVSDPAWAQWAAQLAPSAAIEAISAWLDAGRPDPATIADRVRRVVLGVITAAGDHATANGPSAALLALLSPDRQSPDRPPPARSHHGPTPEQPRR
jgi:AcrR family transcriptional regulator